MTEDATRGVESVRSELGSMINQLETDLSNKIDRLEKRMDDKFDILFQTVQAIDRELQPLVLNYTKMGSALNQSIIQNGKVFHEFDLRLASVEKKVDGLQKQVDGLQKQVDGLQKQVATTTTRLDNLHDDMKAGFAIINEKLDRIVSRN